MPWLEVVVLIILSRSLVDTDEVVVSDDVLVSLEGTSLVDGAIMIMIKGIDSQNWAY